MLRKNVTRILIVATLAITACSKPPITESADKSTREFELDSPFQIRLKGDANSDNEWILANKDLTAVKFVDQSVTTSGDENVFTFDFVAKEEGEDDILMVYSGSTGIERTFQLHVICGTLGRIEGE